MPTVRYQAPARRYVGWSSPNKQARSQRITTQTVPAPVTPKNPSIDNKGVTHFLDCIFDEAPEDAFSTLFLVHKSDHSQHITIPFRIKDMQLAVDNAIDHYRNTHHMYFRMSVMKNAPSEGSRGKATDALGASVLWADIDTDKAGVKKEDALAELLKHTPPPNMIVDSGGGLHAYWWLARFCTNLDSIKERNKWLEYRLKHLGADSVSDVSRVLRLPETLNHKFDPPRSVDVVHLDEDSFNYTLEDFDVLSPEHQASPIDEDWDGLCILDINDPAAYMEKVVEEELGLLAGSQNGTRNITLNKVSFKLQIKAYQCGLSREEMEGIFKQVDEVAQRIGLSDEEIYRTVESARKGASLKIVFLAEDTQEKEQESTSTHDSNEQANASAETTNEDASAEPHVEANKEQDFMPPLPTSAQLPHGMLPRQFEGREEDWFDGWDDTPLRQVSPWMADYITFSHRHSPEGFVDFHVSGGLFALSTVAARRIRVPLADPIYTPLAIAFVARTSLFAKTTTARASLKTLRKAGLGWLLGDDETTPQKLLSDMSGHLPANFEDLDEKRRLEVLQRISMPGQLGWYYDEFDQFINAMMRPGPMAEFAGLLRKLDGCPDEYRYSTRMHGQEIIEKPYLAFLANTTPANLAKFAKRGGEFWNDGFWARFAFITPPQGSWRTKTMELGELLVPDTISDALRQWNERLIVPHCKIDKILDEKGKETGRYHIIREALQSHTIMIDQEAFQAYRRYREALRSIVSESANQDLDGSYVRLADKAMRVAALLASLEHGNRITMLVWMLAQEIAEMFRRNLHELYRQVADGSDFDNPLEEALIAHLKTLNDKAVTVREILQYGPSEIRKQKTDGVRSLLVNLERSGVVQCKRDGKRESYFLRK